jgi:PadR family transcriptional regulator, regulatory protein PadR
MSIADFVGASDLKPGMEHQDLLVGLVRLHILHHAAEHEIYGQWILDELGRHGYRLSAGTLYPLLHSMERRGYLTAETRRVGRTKRRIYRASPLGQEALELVRAKVKELFGELVEGR